MNRNISTLIVLVAFLYLGLGSLFLFLHFRQHEPISGVIADISYVGKIKEKSSINEKEILKFSIIANGMRFTISKWQPLVFITVDGIKHKLYLSSFDSDVDSITLNFKYGIKLIFSSDSHGNTVAITPVVPTLIPEIQKLILSVKIEKGFSLEETENGEGQIAISNLNTTFYLDMPARSQANLARGKLIIPLMESFDTTIVVTPESGEASTPLAWYEQKGSSITDEIYNNKISEYTQKCYSGWSERFNPRTGKWAMPDGTAEFSEDAINSFLSETLQKNAYLGTVPSISGAFYEESPELGFKTIPFLGEMPDKTEAYLAQLKKRRSNISELLNKKDKDIFLEEELVNFLYIMDMEDSLKDLRGMISQPTGNNSLDLTLGKCRTFVDLITLNGSSDQKTESELTSFLSDRILPSVFWINQDLFVFNKNGNADIPKTLLAGKLLIKSANILENKIYLSIGRKMILSVLFHAGENGSCPKEMIYSENTITEKTGVVIAEDIYPLLSDNPYIPKITSLHKKVSPGVWIYTSTEKLTVVHTPVRETSIRLDFQSGATQHLVLHGIKPFSKLYLHDREWRTDPTFERYSDGWYYDSISEMLYVKVTHKAKTERIKIEY